MVRKIEDSDGYTRMTPVNRLVRELEEEHCQKFYLASEVAKELEVSVQSIRKYANKQVCGKDVAPSLKVPFGDIEVNLYTEADVEALRKYLSGRRVIYPINHKV